MKKPSGALFLALLSIATLLDARVTPPKQTRCYQPSLKKFPERPIASELLLENSESNQLRLSAENSSTHLRPYCYLPLTLISSFHTQPPKLNISTSLIAPVSPSITATPLVKLSKKTSPLSPFSINIPLFQESTFTSSNLELNYESPTIKMDDTLKSHHIKSSYQSKIPTFVTDLSSHITVKTSSYSHKTHLPFKPSSLEIASPVCQNIEEANYASQLIDPNQEDTQQPPQKHDRPGSISITVTLVPPQFTINSIDLPHSSFTPSSYDYKPSPQFATVLHMPWGPPPRTSMRKESFYRSSNLQQPETTTCIYVSRFNHQLKVKPISTHQPAFLTNAFTPETTNLFWPVRTVKSPPSSKALTQKSMTDLPCSSSKPKLPQDPSLHFKSHPSSIPHLAHTKTLLPQFFVLESLPLTISLPTLKDQAFTFKSDNLHLTPTSVEQKNYPKHTPRQMLTYKKIIVAQNQTPHRKEPTLFPENRKPHLAKDVYPHWLNAPIRIAPMILEPTHASVATFLLNSAPDSRTLYRSTSRIDQERINYPKHPQMPFASSLIAAIDLGQELETPALKSAPRSDFIPTTETSKVLALHQKHNKAIILPSSASAVFLSFQTKPLTHEDELITSKPLLHPASKQPLQCQLQVSLLTEKRHKEQLVKKRLTHDQHIRQYGHLPTPQKITMQQLKPTSIHALIYNPLPSTSPSLWSAFDCDEKLLTSNFSTEGERSQDADSLNRKSRSCVTELAKLPTLLDLETTSLSQDFTHEVSWAPKANGSRYLFSVKIKPLRDTQFDRLSQNIYFVIDNTRGIEKGTLSSYKSAILRSLPYLHKEDQFNILILDETVQGMAPSNMVINASTKTKARDFLTNLKVFRPYKPLNGYRQLTLLTNHLQKQPGLNTVFFFTDGMTFKELAGNQAAAKNLVQANKTAFNLYPISAGTNIASTYTQALAALQRGQWMHYPTLASFPRKFAALVKKLQNPIARDLHAIAIPRDQTTHCHLFSEAPLIPCIYRGKELVIFGEIDQLSDIDLMVQGKFGDSWVNITKKISFPQSTRSKKSLFDEASHHQTGCDLMQFLLSNDPSFLSKANGHLTRTGKGQIQ